MLGTQLPVSGSVEAPVPNCSVDVVLPNTVAGDSGRVGWSGLNGSPKRVPLPPCSVDVWDLSVEEDGWRAVCASGFATCPSVGVQGTCSVDDEVCTEEVDSVLRGKL